MLPVVTVMAASGELLIIGEDNDDCICIGNRDLVFNWWQQKKFRTFRSGQMRFTVTGEAASLAVTAT